MSFNLVLAFTFLAIVMHTSTGEGETYHGHQVWKVTPSSEAQLRTLKKCVDVFQLEFWNTPTFVGSPVAIRIPPDQTHAVRRYLDGGGIRDIEISILDVQELIENRKRPVQRAMTKSSARNIADFDYGNYHTAEEIYEWIDMVVEEYPSIASKRHIATTYQGRPIYVLEFTKTPSVNPRPVIFVDALIHSGEWISTASLLFIFKEMLRNPAYAHMMDGADWYFIPMINIDGYVETWTGDRFWRRTRASGSSSKCTGVDANRNWDSHWSYTGGSSPNPCAFNFYGPTPFSESEIRHIANYILDFGVGSIDAYVSTHAYAEMILYAYGYTEAPAEHDETLRTLGKLMSDAVRSVHGREYVYGPASTTIYPASGITTDWTYDVAEVNVSYTYELRDIKEHGLLLPPEQIIPNGEEYLAGLEVLKNYVVENFNRKKKN